MNETLERKPGDPDFIVELHADRVLMNFDSRSLRLLGTKREVAVARWRPEWASGFAE